MSGNSAPEQRYDPEGAQRAVETDLADATESAGYAARNAGWVRDDQTPTKWGEQRGPDTFRRIYRERLGRLQQDLQDLELRLTEHAENVTAYLAQGAMDDADAAAAFKTATGPDAPGSAPE